MDGAPRFAGNEVIARYEIMKTKMRTGSDIETATIGWDVVNWSESLYLWEKLEKTFEGKRILELGCGETGGLSLWFASRGADVTCSDYFAVSPSIRQIHKEYGVTCRYESIDACNIPYEEEFDYVCWKSMLGGVVRSGNVEIATEIIDQVRKSLRNRGKILFAENLRGSHLHEVFRIRWGAGKNAWKYWTMDELETIFSHMKVEEIRTFGVAGCLGRNERQKRVLGYVDKHLLTYLAPKSWHYIAAGVVSNHSKLSV